MEPENQNTPTQSANEKRPKTKWLGLKRAGVIAFAVTLTTLVANGTTIWNNTFGPSDSKPETTQVKSDPTSPAIQEPATTKTNGALSSLSSGGFEEGCFLAEQGNLERIACDSPHNAEIFASSQSCNQETLLTHLGGVPGVDVVRKDLSIADAPDQGCLLTLPSGIQLTSTAEMALTKENSEYLRQCHDAKTNSDVGCDETHTAEVVKIYAPGSTETANCREAAEEYLGVRQADFTSQLSMELQKANDSRRCLVAARGDNILTATLRDISNSSLPLTADNGSRG